MFHIFHIFHIFQHPMNKWMRNDFGNIQGIGDKDLEWWMLRMTSKCAVAGHEHVIEFGNNSKPSQYYHFYGYQIKAKWDRLVAWLFHIILIPSGNFLQFAIEYRNDGCFMDDSTLWLFNIVMEHGPFIDDFPINTSIYFGDFPWLC